MRYIVSLFGSIIALLLMTLPVGAHHSGAIYDSERKVRLQGTVVKIKWANPHVYIDIETKGDTGESAQWIIEGLAPTGMIANGWTRSSLVPGEEITVAGSPARVTRPEKSLGAILHQG